MKNYSCRWLMTAMVCCLSQPHVATAVTGASEPAACLTDRQTGLALPDGRAGLCVSSDYLSTTVVQKLDDGVVFSLLSTPAGDAATLDSAGRRIIRTHDPAALVIYCPSNHIDPATGMPDAACVADVATMTPGPAAFTGQAVVAASLTQDDRAQAACPGSIRVMGELVGPQGSSYHFLSTAVVTRAPDGACNIAYDAMELRPRFDENLGTGLMDAAASDPFATYRRLEQAAESLDRLAAAEGEGWHALDQLAEMNDDELALMRWYLTADEEAQSRLDAILAEDGVAVLGATGNPDRMTATGQVAPGEIIVTNGLAADIKDRVNAIYSRVVGIASRVNIVPVKTNVVALIDKLTNAIPVDQIGERITDVGEELQDFAEEIRARRQGLPEFVGNDCDPLSACGQFRQDLGRMFDNLERVGFAIQQMVCSEVPNIQTRTIEFTVVRNILVENDRAPKIVLFLMSRILDQVNGWQLEGLVSTLPMDALAAMCNEARGTNASFKVAGTQVVRTSGKNAVCTVLRPKPVGGNLKRSAARVGVLDWSIKQLDALFPEDKTVGVSVIAVGGGGFSVTRKGIPATLSEILIANLGTMKSLLEKVEARREACLGDEERWEKDLYTCRPKIEYLTNDTNVLRDLFGLVQRQANAIGKNEATRANQSRTARRKAEAWFEAGDYRNAYGCVCNAYQKLVIPDPKAAYSCS